MRPSNWTIRVRLTVLYGGLFFLAGAVLLGLTYLLVKQSLDSRVVNAPSSLERIPDLIRARSDPALLSNLLTDLRNDQEQFKADTLDTLLTQAATALAVVGVAAVGFGWLMAERVLRPLDRITDTAARIAATGLHERIALAGPRDEITKLADTFDSMLERLDRSFDGQRRFVANASHELRTPLAINRALIELAVSRPDASTDTVRLGESLLAINARHERLIDGLLTLADSETAVSHSSTVDLADVVTHVMGTIDAPDLTVSTDLAPAPTRGDPVLLERLVHNLIENAVRHNVTGGRFDVATRVADGRAELVVANTGPSVPPYETSTIFLPFRRLTDERASPDRGFGLGLSIVAAVTRAHDGTVTAAPRDGGGLILTVSIPLATRREEGP